MYPELFTTLKSYCNGGDERSAKMNRASLGSALAAASRGTMHTFGEYACNKCFEFHLIRLGGRCGIRNNGKQCGGICNLVKNVHGEWVQALDYSLNTGGRDGACVRNHIGLIGQDCSCYCSGTKNRVELLPKALIYSTTHSKFHPLPSFPTKLGHLMMKLWLRSQAQKHLLAICVPF